MHPKNIHNTPYNFVELIQHHKVLSTHVFINSYSNQTIDFSKPESVLHLNTAILKSQYQLTDWNIPKGYLCPPIPGRADYIHHIADLIDDQTTGSMTKGLDIGVGANCIYPILGTQLYNWQMVGCDSNVNAITAAQKNIDATKGLSNTIEVRLQNTKAQIFTGIIHPNEYYHFSMCNPPFHSNRQEANKGTLRKLHNLQNLKEAPLNFGGQANELWCNGGEALFIKRMIKESVRYAKQVGWFTSLVSKKENLPKLYKQLNKIKAKHTTIDMQQGNKQSRFIAWTFDNLKS